RRRHTRFSRDWSSDVCSSDLTDAFAQLDERHGEPLTEAGQRPRFWVIGMGKLGARELNVSSDIDLIYLYEEDGQTRGRADGRGQISVHEYFGRAARLDQTLIGDPPAP